MVASDERTNVHDNMEAVSENMSAAEGSIKMRLHATWTTR